MARYGRRVALGKLLQKVQARHLAFFWVKLGSEQVSEFYRGAKFNTVVGGQRDLLRIGGSNVIGVNKIEVRFLPDRIELVERAGPGNHVPPHMGNLQGRVNLKPGDISFKNTQALVLPPLVTFLEKQLQTQANTQERPILANPVDDGLA